MQKMRRRRMVVVVGLALAVLGWGVFDYLSAKNTELPPQDQAVLSESNTQNPGSIVLASEALGKLAVKASAGRENYSREQFGNGWSEINGCDIRNLILKRDLQTTVLDSDNCTVLSGVLSEDPYTGAAIEQL